jgi:hypothetical protein
VSRYSPPDPKCHHVPTVRVSSHEDLLAEFRPGEPVASTYCCDRPECITDAREWVWASTHRDAHVVRLPGRETR